MGCDIHGSIEKKVNDKWVHVTRITYDFEIGKRCYARFAALAGVRGDGPAPLGFPADASDSTRLHRADWGEDGHSDSVLGLAEACTRLQSADRAEPGMMEHDYPASHYFELEDENIHEYRFVFWFDN